MKDEVIKEIEKVVDAHTTTETVASNFIPEHWVEQRYIANPKKLKQALCKVLEEQLDRLEGCEWVTIPINFGMRCRYTCNRCEYHSEHKYSFCPSCGRKSKLKELRGGEGE